MLTEEARSIRYGSHVVYLIFTLLIVEDGGRAQPAWAPRHLHAWACRRRGTERVSLYE